MAEKPLVGIDARTIADPSAITGVGVTVDLLVDYLDAQGVECVLFYDQTPRKKYRHHQQVVLTPTPRPFWEQGKLGSALRELNIGLYHETWNYGLPWNLPPGVKTITTIHDLILLDEPAPSLSPKEQLFFAYRRRAIRSAIKRSDHLIAVSRETATELARRFPLSETKTTLIYNGIRQSFFTPPAAKPTGVFKRYGITKPYLLYFGGFHPRKNVAFLAKAFLAAGLTNYQLVLAGAVTPAFKDFLGGLTAEQRAQIVLPGYVDLEDQPALYHHAALFVSPSLAEGFGYPMAEAMASQTLTLASDLPILREVGGKAVSYFNPTEGTELTLLLKKMTQLPAAERRAILTAQSKQAAQFSAENMGKQTLALYNRVLHES